MTIEANGPGEIWLRCGSGDGNVISIMSESLWHGDEIILRGYADGSDESCVELAINPMEIIALARMLEAMAADAMKNSGESLE